MVDCDGAAEGHVALEDTAANHGEPRGGMIIVIE
jgi:hypothetical protein